MANRAQRHVEVVREVARILDTDHSGVQVKRVLRRYLNRLQRDAPRRGRGACTGHFVDHVVELARRYWPGLFHAYDHPEIPRTSNGIEGFFSSIKRAIRSTTGRASTAGGKTQTCAELLVPARALVGVTPPQTLAVLLQAVPDSDYVKQKQELVRIRAPAKEQRSIQRRLGAFLQRALAAWESPSH